MPDTQKITPTPSRKLITQDPAMLLVQLMEELKLDVGPESQSIDITLPTYDTFAYVCTTFAVNGYEVKLIEYTSVHPSEGKKHIIGTVYADGWRISLHVYNVPITEGETPATAQDTVSGHGVRDEQQGPVHGGVVPRRPRRRKGTSPVPSEAGAGRTPSNHAGIAGGGE